MTILFTQIIQHANFTKHIDSEATMQGFLLGLIVGSNLGACLTLVGSLAGIMSVFFFCFLYPPFK